MAKILISGGGTKEAIDGVRYISNFSTGNTAKALADYFFEQNHDIVLLTSNTVHTSEKYLIQYFSDYKSLDTLLEKNLANNYFDFYISCAAISDYSIESIIAGEQKFSPSADIKISSEHENIHLLLKKNKKLISKISSYSKNSQIQSIAFKLTNNASDAEVKVAVAKVFQNPNINLVIHNDKTSIDKNSHTFHIFSKDSCLKSKFNLSQLSIFLRKYFIKKGINHDIMS